MPEYIVDCEHVPYGKGMVMVLPVSISSHVHERLIRCEDCDYCSITVPHYCRSWHVDVFDLKGFCHRAQPRRYHA